MGQEDQDALLQRFLSEEDPAIAQACLETLLSEHVEPVVRDITRYKSRSNYAFGCTHEFQDEEDIRSEVVLQLISRLRDLKRSGARAPIENFRGYVAVTTYNAYYKYLRMKHPGRARLKNRIRYLVNHRREFLDWRTEQQEYVCGLSGWKTNQASKNARSEEPPIDLDEFVQSLASGKSVTNMGLDELVRGVLVWRGRPILLDDLVGIVAELQGIKDPQPALSHAEDEDENLGISICNILPDPAPDIATTIEQRSYLERLWQEICQLPQRQRVALLLNLRDSQARDALILFTLTGIASLRQIARVMEIPSEEFAPLWNRLPMEDSAIADLLGLTRQQVINLRKSARERLTRRMAVC